MTAASGKSVGCMYRIVIVQPCRNYRIWLLQEPETEIYYVVYYKYLIAYHKKLQ